MIDIEKLKNDIVDTLKPLDPYRVILFGSYAYGTPTEDSDLDLYVVTNDTYMPKNWQEKSKVQQKVSQALKEIMKQYPTDLITHTRAMHARFVEMDSMFSRKVLNEGITLL